MQTPIDMAERHSASLARLIARGEALAMRVADDAEAAQDPDRRERLALSFHRLCRGLRQCMLVEAKLARDARADANAASSLRKTLRAREAGRRKAQVEAALRGEVAERPELEAELTALLKDAEHFDDFFDAPLERVITGIRRTLALSSSPLGGGAAEGDGGGFPPDAMDVGEPHPPGGPLQSRRDISPEAGATRAPNTS